jgi:serine/threonine protein kinase
MWPKPLKRYEPGDLFAGRFTIVEFVAEGGMGVVYKAIDRQVGGEVALKLLPDRLAGHEDFVARFQREVRLTRQINHPNVCRVYDSGVYQSTLYFFMEWVKGETLADLVRHSGTIREDRALEIAEKVARALEAAHARGVIHRDIKPSNIMIDEHGEVRVMDFGVAGEVGAQGTLTGHSPGTPGYMSPEQQRGRRVDARSDLYSLGLVLQEMLTGDPYAPPRGRTAALVSHLCAEDQDRRFPSAAVAATEIAKVRGKASSTPHARPSWLAQESVRTAVFVFAVILGVVGAAVGIQQWLKSRSTRLYQKAEKMRSEAETIPAWDDAIHTFYLSALADTNNALAWAGLGETYWTRYERTKEQLSRDEAEQDVARALSIDGRLPQARLAKAHGFIAVGKAEDAKNVLLALTKDEPRMDQAWAYLGRAEQQLKQKEDGLKALQRAVALNPKSWRTHVQLGQFYKRNQDYPNAEHEFQIALEYKPTSPTAWLNLGGALLLENKTLEALTALETGVKYDPTSGTYSNLGTTYYYLKDYAKAADRYTQASQLEPDNPTYAGNLGDALRMEGDSTRADSVYAEALKLSRAVLDKAPDDITARNMVARMYARVRDTSNALIENTKALQQDSKNADGLFDRAVICSVQRKDDEAVDWLSKAVHVGLGKAQILNDPDLTRLQGQPRFDNFIASLN